MTTLFNYTGSPIPVYFSKGVYFIELWGASSRQDNKTPGKGGYVSGFFLIIEQVTMYLYIGQQGDSSCDTIFNGGGIGQYSGGGA